MGAGKSHLLRELRARALFGLDRFTVTDPGVVRSLLPETRGPVLPCVLRAWPSQHVEYPAS